MNFPRVAVGELFEVRSGNTAPQATDAFGDDGTPFVRAGSLVSLLQGAPESSLERISAASARRNGLRLFPRDTILFAKSGMSALKGYVYQLDNPAHVSSHLAALIPTAKVHARYVRWALDVFSPTHLVKDPAYPSIRLPEIEQLEIPLPPLDEQRRIAAILDQADALRRKRREVINKLERLGPAIFDEMFGSPIAGGDNSAACLHEVAELINGDRSSNYPSGDDLITEGIVFLGTKNLVNGEIDLAAANFISPEKLSTLTRGKLIRNDIIIILRGSLGECAVFDCKFETDFINAQMMIIRPGKRLLAEYTYSFLTHPRVKAALIGQSSGSAVPQLTAAQIGNLRLPIPDIRKQAAFSLRIQRIRVANASIKRHAENLDALFASLQHRAFRGELQG